MTTMFAVSPSNTGMLVPLLQWPGTPDSSHQMACCPSTSSPGDAITVHACSSSSSSSPFSRVLRRDSVLLPRSALAKLPPGSACSSCRTFSARPPGLAIITAHAILNSNINIFSFNFSSKSALPCRHRLPCIASRLDEFARALPPSGRLLKTTKVKANLA